MITWRRSVVSAALLPFLLYIRVQIACLFHVLPPHVFLNFLCLSVFRAVFTLQDFELLTEAVKITQFCCRIDSK